MRAIAIAASKAPECVLGVSSNSLMMRFLLLGGRCFLSSLLFGLVSAVFFLVRNQVCLGLLRGKFGRCRGLGIPRKMA